MSRLAPLTLVSRLAALIVGIALTTGSALFAPAASAQSATATHTTACTQSGRTVTCATTTRFTLPSNTALQTTTVNGNVFVIVNTSAPPGNTAPNINSFSLSGGSAVTAGASVLFSYSVTEANVGQVLTVRLVRTSDGVEVANRSFYSDGTAQSGTLTWAQASSSPTPSFRLEVSDGAATAYSAAITLQVSAPASTETLTFIHPHITGSPLMATDADGNVVWREDYSAFGERKKNETNANAGTNANQNWFIGKPQDTQTGLVYFGQRWYDPQIGRFISMDPAEVDEGNPHSFNRYAYGNNNPNKYLDPDGRAVETIWDAASLTVGIHSASQSYASGKWGALAVDVIGVVVDAAATAVPFVPGGAGMAIAATRGAGKAIDAVSATKGANSSTTEMANVQGLMSRQGPSEMSGSRVKALAKDMKANGFDASKPIQVATVDGKSIIVDGHHRVEAAKRAGIRDVPVVRGEVSGTAGQRLLQEAAAAKAERINREQ
ncbi:MAG: RHS repeat-associated core domain-containing protein [Casimicrobium sp.]